MHRTPHAEAPGVVTRKKFKLHATDMATEPPMPNLDIYGNLKGNRSVKSEMLHVTTTKSVGAQFVSPQASLAPGKSVGGRSTCSSLARRKQLELEAAQAKATIQMQLIDKQLEANLAHLDAEERDDVTERSQSMNGEPAEATLNNVQVWLENSQVKSCAATEHPVRNPPPHGTIDQQRPCK